MIKKLVIIFFFLTAISMAETVKTIKISGNERISTETIQMFSNVNLGVNVEQNEINKILKDLYETNFFKDVQVSLNGNVLNITVLENPIIQNIYFNGIKNKNLEEEIIKTTTLKSRSSFSETLIKEDLDTILFTLKKNGYFFSSVDVLKEDLKDNKIDLTYQVDLGDKAKIKQIKFLGPKIYKDRKLKNIILSEEYKFWKFLSGRKFLNEDLINFDKRLLKNYYLNKGYYYAEVNSSFAKLTDDNGFELIYNVNPGEKVFFDEFNLKLPNDFDPNNYKEINSLFKDLKGEPYSLYQVENILDEIEKITTEEEFGSVKANVNENIMVNKINLSFSIDELKASYITRINILGNNITEESVIRNQIIIDEGDPYNEILLSKSINNIKSLNIFKSVKKEILIDENDVDKILNITLEEKPTGEILAGAGYGTNGGTLTFSVKENNFLGRGISLDNSILLTESSIKGKIFVENPNYKNSDKSLFYGVESTENDFMTKYGYKNNKTSASIGTSFEYLDDLNFGIASKNSIENLKVGDKASKNQKKQAGNYFDSFLSLDFNYDKRNQRFETNDGFFSRYSIDLPILSDTSTLNNSYKYKTFEELYENNISTFSFLITASNSLSGDNIKLSERLFVPSRSLRGFESGKIGPKDGDDFIGGNFVSSINLTSTLPKITENIQNVDLGIFFDAANIWGVDYDSSLENNDEIRSSIGIGIDWATVIGPMSFSLAQPITKSSSDVTETFRFNIGTTF